MALVGKNLPAKAVEIQVPSLGWEDPLEKEMATHSISPGKYHGQRSLVGYSTWGHEESDMTECYSVTTKIKKKKNVYRKSNSGPGTQKSR